MYSCLCAIGVLVVKAVDVHAWFAAGVNTYSFYDPDSNGALVSLCTQARDLALPNLG